MSVLWFMSMVIEALNRRAAKSAQSPRGSERTAGPSQAARRLSALGSPLLAARRLRAFCNAFQRRADHTRPYEFPIKKRHANVRYACLFRLV